MTSHPTAAAIDADRESTPLDPVAAARARLFSHSDLTYLFGTPRRRELLCTLLVTAAQARIAARTLALSWTDSARSGVGAKGSTEMWTLLHLAGGARTMIGPLGRDIAAIVLDLAKHDDLRVPAESLLGAPPMASTARLLELTCRPPRGSIHGVVAAHELGLAASLYGLRLLEVTRRTAEPSLVARLGSLRIAARATVELRGECVDERVVRLMATSGIEQAPETRVAVVDALREVLCDCALEGALLASALPAR